MRLWENNPQWDGVMKEGPRPAQSGLFSSDSVPQSVLFLTYCNRVIVSLCCPPQRGMDSLSMKSSDSDVSDVSAMSSASRLSSASYMSVQSERARAARKIRWGVDFDLRPPVFYLFICLSDFFSSRFILHAHSFLSSLPSCMLHDCVCVRACFTCILLYMCVCVCFCVYVYVPVHVHLSLYVRVFACLCVSILLCVYLCVCVCSRGEAVQQSQSQGEECVMEEKGTVEGGEKEGEGEQINGVEEEEEQEEEPDRSESCERSHSSPNTTELLMFLGTCTILE